MPIFVLPVHEAQKIAAGEVVERPANIVKELIENSIDAGAWHITIFIEDGGKKLIRIVDNGCGMNQSDAEICFIKHATSKLQTIEELHTLQTFGFRGEALTSIAAIAQVTLQTKEHHALEGYHLSIHGGTVMEKKSTNCPAGTDMCVENIFYNLPARKKFLKSSSTEWHYIVQLIQAFSLDYPSIHFTLYNDGKESIQCPTASSVAQRCIQLFDQGTQFISIAGKNNDYNVAVNGVISPYQHSMYNKNLIFFFINKRWVKNYQLGRALLAGYNKGLPPGRYPVATVSLELDTHQVDINIHPRKEEVKFMYPRIVEHLIEQSVAAGLEQHTTTQLHKTEKTTPNPFISTLDNSIPVVTKNFVPPIKNNFFPASHLHHAPDINLSVTPPSPSLPLSSPTYSVLGQYAQTYIMLEHADGLMLVDQHAAHERILYELFSYRFDSVSTVALLFPHYIALSARDYDILSPHLQLLTDNGIQTELLSQNQIIITATPVHLKDRSLDDLVRQTVAWIDEYEKLEQKEFFATIHEKIRAQMACKAAVKAGDILSMDQMQQLIRDLYLTKIHATCPHGRPTTFLISLYEIEKKFKRK
jgi:DNA mismatch repair protein MutL